MVAERLAPGSAVVAVLIDPAGAPGAQSEREPGNRAIEVADVFRGVGGDQEGIYAALGETSGHSGSPCGTGLRRLSGPPGPSRLLPGCFPELESGTHRGSTESQKEPVFHAHNSAEPLMGRGS